MEKQPFVTDENYKEIVLFLADMIRTDGLMKNKPPLWEQFWRSAKLVPGRCMSDLLKNDLILYLESKLLPTEDEKIIEALYQYHQKRDPRP